MGPCAGGAVPLHTAERPRPRGRVGDVNQSALFVEEGGMHLGVDAVSLLPQDCHGEC